MVDGRQELGGGMADASGDWAGEQGSGAAPAHRVDIRVGGSVDGSIIVGDDNVVVRGDVGGLASLLGRPPVTGGSPTSTERRARGLSPREICELANVFHRPAGATQVLAEAGIPPDVQPSWQEATASEFWHEVGHLVEAGIVADGAGRILAAASRRFPANEVFNPSA
jgi:Effector-associated domain 1